MPRRTCNTVTAALCALVVTTALPVRAQTAPHQTRRPAAERQSHFYIKGPNAPYKNQIRKMTDPLNANGAGK